MFLRTMSAVLVGNGWRFPVVSIYFSLGWCELFFFLCWLSQIRSLHCLGNRRRRRYNRPSRQSVSSTVWNLPNRQPEEEVPACEPCPRMYVTSRSALLLYPFFFEGKKKPSLLVRRKRHPPPPRRLRSRGPRHRTPLLFPRTLLLLRTVLRIRDGAETLKALRDARRLALGPQLPRCDFHLQKVRRLALLLLPSSV